MNLFASGVDCIDSVVQCETNIDPALASASVKHDLYAYLFACGSRVSVRPRWHVF